jgi:sporulation protein YlmC with PRC-barrel domain
VGWCAVDVFAGRYGAAIGSAGGGDILPCGIDPIYHWHFRGRRPFHKFLLLQSATQQETAMNKLTLLASTAALAMALTAPLGYAQSLTGSPILVLADHSMSAHKLIGMQVADDKGIALGTVVDVLVKDAAAEPLVILSVGEYVGGGSKLVAVPLSHVKIDGTKVMMPGATKQMMASMKLFKFEGLNGGGG